MEKLNTEEEFEDEMRRMEADMARRHSETPLLA